MKCSQFSFAIFTLATLAAGPAGADDLDASKPLTCSLTEAAECDGVAFCHDVTLDQIALPPLWRVDFAAKQLKSQDGLRTSPITVVDEVDSGLVIQGNQNGRAWTIVVERGTGHVSATVTDNAGAFVIAGSCTAD